MLLILAMLRFQAESALDRALAIRVEAGELPSRKL